MKNLLLITILSILLLIITTITTSCSSKSDKPSTDISNNDTTSTIPKKKHIEFKKILTFAETPIEDVKESELIQPTVVVMDSKGSSYILDIFDMTIKKYDPSGLFLLSFGRKGSGPGEFESAYRMRITPDDKIVIHDMMRGFNFFNSDGTFIELKRTPVHKDHEVRGFKIANNGKFYIETHTIDWSGEKHTLYKISEITNNFTESILLDSAYVNDNKYITEPTYTNVCQPYPPLLYWDIDPITSNIIIGKSGDYSIKIFSPKPELIKEFKHKGKKFRVLDIDKKEFYKGLTFSSGGVVTKEMPKYVKKNTKFPDFKPFFQGLYCDQKGNICVSMGIYSGDNKFDFDYFSNNGEFLGEVTIPIPRWNNFQKNKILTFTYNEEGFAGVSVYEQ